MFFDFKTYEDDIKRFEKALRENDSETMRECIETFNSRVPYGLVSSFLSMVEEGEFHAYHASTSIESDSNEISSGECFLISSDMFVNTMNEVFNEIKDAFALICKHYEIIKRMPAGVREGGELQVFTDLNDGFKNLEVEVLEVRKDFEDCKLKCSQYMYEPEKLLDKRERPHSERSPRAAKKRRMGE